MHSQALSELDVKQISCGERSFVLLTHDGKVYSQLYNAEKQVGHCTFVMRYMYAEPGYWENWQNIVKTKEGQTEAEEDVRLCEYISKWKYANFAVSV